MNRPDSLRDILPTLIRRGLPAEYAERAAAELADHHRDLFDELQATGLSESQASAEASQRLGDSRTLVKNTVRAYQRRYWCARWPLVTFLLAPIPLWIAAYVATALVMRIVVRGLAAAEFIPTNELHVARAMAPQWFKFMLMAWLFVGIPTVVTFGLARQAQRAALGWRWVLLVACLTGFSAGSIRIAHMAEVDPPTRKPLTTQPHRYSITLPLIEPNWWYGWGKNGWRECYGGHPLQAFMLLMPLAAGGAFLLHDRRLTRRAEKLAVGHGIVPGADYEHAKCA